MCVAGLPVAGEMKILFILQQWTSLKGLKEGLKEGGSSAETFTTLSLSRCQKTASHSSQVQNQKIFKKHPL